MENWINAGSLEEIKADKAKVIKGAIAVFNHEDKIYAVDNRCPHLGFPLHLGSMCDGILTCHWHHARFDLSSGGTLDPWADDVPSYETKVEKGEVWVNHTSETSNQIEEYQARLLKGMKQNLGLVIAKAVVGLMKAGISETKIIQTGIQFGSTHRNSGWGPGLTILSAMANTLPKLDQQGRIQALYQGLARVASDCAGNPPKHLVGPLAGFDGDTERLKIWYRNCIEVRDTQGAERVLLTAIENNMSVNDLSSMMMTAATDHFLLDGGHTLDFHNKAFEVLKHTDKDLNKEILASLTPLFSNAVRSEELHSWQAPINLVTPLLEAFDKVKKEVKPSTKYEFNEQELLHTLLDDKPIETIDAITNLFIKGADRVRIGQIVALAAAERVVMFYTQNDFRDWDTVLHTFTHAHAVHESVRRSDETLLIRAIYHGAVSIYLDRFLNIPATKRPIASESYEYSLDHKQLLHILDKQQQVNESANWVVNYLHANHDKRDLFNTLGHALLREDAGFHTYQMFEAACAEYDYWEAEESALAERAKESLIIAVTRYLAAHAPTPREVPHIGKIAWRLHQGENLFEEE